MKINIPDDLTDEQKEAIAKSIAEMLEQGGNLILDQPTVKQGLYLRFVNWWYSFWRGVGFN